MKKLTVKVITVSSQILVVSLFIALLFIGKVDNDKVVTYNNNNFNKMSDSTFILFEDEIENEVKEDVVEEFNTDEVVIEEPVEEALPSTSQTEVITSYSDNPAITTYVGNLTGYGPDCYGCTTGLTSTGHNLYESIYYDDYEYGTVRILAGDHDIPFYSIIRISNVPGMDPFLGIVLDRGGNVGFPEKGKGTMFDLAYSSEKDPNLVPLTHNVTFELLRSGK